MYNLVDIAVVFAIGVGVFFAVRKSVKSKGCAGCSESGGCSGGCCSSADKMVADMEKAASQKK